MDAESSDLQKEINLPAHPHAGPLTLFYVHAGGPGLELGDGNSCCSICGKRTVEKDFIYRCPDPDCDFKVDIPCSSIESIIEFDGHHHHPLCFVEKAAPGIGCRSCHVGPSDLDLPMFRCGECGFSLHLLCGPLPRVVQYMGYELTLTDSLLSGVDADDCWCDICEEQRDPAQCVYHSPDILFTASIDCLLPQIILALKGDLGGVELRTVGGCITGRVIVKDPAEEAARLMKAKSKIHGGGAVEEAATSGKAEEAPEPENSVLGLIDMTTYHALASILTKVSEQFKEEDEHYDSATGNMYVDLLASILTTLSGQFTELLHLDDSKEVLPDRADNEVYEGGAVDKAVFPLLSQQVLCSLTDEQALEFDDAFDKLARRISKAKVDADFPYFDLIQWYKEKADISHLEGDGWPMKPEPKNGTVEVAEERVFTFIQMMRSLTSEDINRIEDAFRKCTKHGEDSEAPLDFLRSLFPLPVKRWDFHYSDESFKQFKEQLDLTDSVNDSYIMAWKRYAFKTVKVGETMIPSHFAPIYQELAEKYGDFSTDSELGPLAKALIFHHFFAVVYSMRGTQVLEITDDLLCTWLFYLRIVQSLGFNIEFVVDNFENLVRAHFGLKVVKFRDETTENLEKQIEELSRQVHEKERKLGELKAIRERYKKPKDAEESLVKKCLLEAAKWKWKDVGDLIL
ncbi:uncharacterized protein LOC116215918 [Punica granatum]|nr:uncharacterized protein LOC116215918 [Punica granatum]PKI46315.1 hypothetical protein CRG98_033291 [Punica granatum]